MSHRHCVKKESMFNKILKFSEQLQCIIIQFFITVIMTKVIII